MSAQVLHLQKNRPRPMGAFAAYAGALVAAALTLSSCVTSGNNGGNPEEQGQSDSPSQPGPTPTGSEKDPVIASTITTSTEAGTNLRIDIHSLKRQENETVVLEFSMSNVGDKSDAGIPGPPAQGDGSADNQPFSLVNGIHRKKHLPLLYSDGNCYCSNWSDTKLASGESLSGWIAFPAPPDAVKRMIFTSAIAPPVLDVPISGAGKSVAHPASGQLEDPERWDIRSLENNLSEQETRQETGDEVAISLSTDVLFDVEKSTLNKEAQEQLERAAKEIDGASGNVVKVDGHTDNSGNDSINDPLSLDRAKATKKALSRLIDRPGVEFEVNGHGSSKPIATNDTERGRKKNRRVTITFTR